MTTNNLLIILLFLNKISQKQGFYIPKIREFLTLKQGISWRQKISYLI